MNLQHRELAMAIKPTDHIVYLRDLVIGYKDIAEMYTVVIYADYWQNLIDYVEARNPDFSVHTKEINRELAKYGAKYNHKKGYIKFANEADHTWFVMHWQWRNT